MKKLFTCLCLLYPFIVNAIDELSLELAGVTGTGWELKHISLVLQRSGQTGMSFNAKVGAIHLPSLPKPLTHINVSCPNGTLSEHQISCAETQVQFQSNVFDTVQLLLAFNYQLQSKQLTLEMNRFSFADGTIHVKAHSNPEGWQAHMTIEKMALEKIFPIIRLLISIPAGMSLSGRINLETILKGQKGLESAQVNTELKEVTFANADSTQATDKLGIQWVATLESLSANISKWHVRNTMTVREGELLSQPFYFKVAEKPIVLQSDLTWQPNHLSVHQITYDHADILNLQGSAEIQWDQTVTLEKCKLQSQPIKLAALYTHYLQPWLTEGQSNLQLTGNVQTMIECQSTDNHRATLDINHINVVDKKKHWGINDLNGSLRWHSAAINLPSSLNWSSIFLVSKTILKAGQVQMDLHGRQIALLKPFRQPILDGALHIDKFQLAHLGEDDMTWELQGQLHPISMSEVGRLLQLPLSNGKLSATFPSLQYHKQLIELGNRLLIQVFGGEITVNTLKVQDILGKIPKLWADIAVNKMNLEMLTKIANLGEIRGQLSGYIRDLHCINWQPVTFDAFFMTPSDNQLTKKISQRAVRNLSKLSGNNPVNIISRNVLRLFENFSYDKLGWGCRLKNSVCDMWGVEAAPDNGYYIVKGSTLPPRIDVIGYNSRVNWDILLERLKNLKNVGDPIIE